MIGLYVCLWKTCVQSYYCEYRGTFMTIYCYFMLQIASSMASLFSGKKESLKVTQQSLNFLIILMNQAKTPYDNNYLTIIIAYFSIILLYQEIQIIKDVINTTIFSTQ